MSSSRDLWTAVLRCGISRESLPPVAAIADSCRDWTLLSSWSLFASPVCAIVDLPIKGTRRLLALISSNSPIALVDLSMLPAPLLFILPGTRSPVTIMSSNLNGELLVVYESGLARVCDVAGQELRRSMDYKTAVALLAEAGWVNWFTLGELQPSNEPSARLHGPYPAPVARLVADRPADPILTVDLRTTIDRASGMLPWAKSNKSVSSKGKSQRGNDSCDLTADTKKSHDHLGLVQFLLAQTIPFGVDLETDWMLEDHLGVQRPSVVMDVALQRYVNRFEQVKLTGQVPPQWQCTSSDPPKMPGRRPRLRLRSDCSPSSVSSASSSTSPVRLRTRVSNADIC